jgi:gliding motility-associated-like protein
MKRVLLFLILIVPVIAMGQTMNISSVSTTGRFNSCAGAPLPNVQVNYISGSGTTFSNGAIVCSDPCGTTTIQVQIDSISWQQQPDAEWLHGIFLPANQGYSVTGINLPTGFITYNAGCTGQCPVGISAGPGFYFDATAGNDCCGFIFPNDGNPCNNYGKTSINCSNKFSLNFYLTFCNSILTTNTETFTLNGTSDGATGCWSYFNIISNTIAFTVNVVPCPTAYTGLYTASAITRTCTNGIPNYTTTLSGGCGNGNTVNWWSSAFGGTLLGTGSSFIYDPAGSICPGGQTIYASCCVGGSTSCVNRQAVVIPGTCDPLVLISVTAASGTCTSPSSVSAVSLSNVIGSVTYTLNPGNQSNATGVFTGLTQSSYTLTATDASNCSVSTVLSFTPIQQPSLSAVATPIDCFGGTSTLTLAGGLTPGPYTFSVNNAAFQSNTSYGGLVAGSYTVVVKDAANCTASSIVSITQPTLLTVSASASGILCQGGATTITANGSGGVTPYEFKLNSSSYQSSNVFSGQASGSYTVTIKDANNCTSSTVVLITQPSAVAVSLTAPAIACQGGTTSITATGSGGTTAYQYNINGGAYQSSGIFSGQTAGTYTVIIKDANNCTATSVISLAQPPILTLSASTAPIPCFGSATTLTVSASGGAGALTYSLNSSAFQTSNAFSPVLVGTYTVVVKDANNCTKSTLLTVTQPTPVTVTASAGSILCQGGNATITALANGGNGTYQYQLNAGALQASPTFNNVSAGTYTITARDGNNCLGSTVLTLMQPPQLLVSATASTILCNAGITTISATAIGGVAGYQYSLNGGSFQSSNTFSSVLAGTYTIVGKDANNCTASTVVVLNQPPVLTLSASAGIIACQGGTSSITAIGGGGTPGYQYSLNGGVFQGSGTFNALTAGAYTVVVKDANNCTLSTTLSITQPSLLSVALLSTPINCFGGNSTLTATGGGGTPAYQYSLNGGVFQSANSFSNQLAGTYTVTIKDANNCTKTSTITVTQPTVVTVTATATAISCNGGTSTITASGSGGVGIYQFNLNNGAFQTSGTFSSLPTGTYTVGVKDGNGCTASTLVTIAQPVPLTISVNATSILCFGGSTTLTVTAGGGTPGYQYKLNTGSYQSSNIFNAVLSGTYTLTISDANNCTASTVTNVSQPTQVMLSASATSILCHGGTATLTANASGGSGTYQYALNGGSFQTGNSFTNVVAGTYTLTAKDANNCTASTILVITQPVTLTTAAIAGSIGCQGSTTSLTATATGGVGGYQYKLNAGAFQASATFSPLTAGTYTIQVKDANNCTASTVVTITQPTPLSLTLAAPNILCFGNTVAITASAIGGTPTYQYALNGGLFQSGNSFSNLGAGSYTVVVKDANNCTASSVMALSQPSLLQISSASTAILCNGNNSTLTVTGSGGTPTYTYSLNGGVYQSSNQFTALAGNYTVTLKDANNCTVTTNLVINQPTVLAANTTHTAISCQGGASTITMVATGGTPAYQYKLNAGLYQTSGVFAGNLAGTYTLTAKDANNCTISTVVVISQPALLGLTVTPTVITCFGGTASLTATANGGTPVYQYGLNGGALQSSGNYSNLIAGSYTVVVQDANGCTKSTVLAISQPPLLTVSLSSTAIACNGNFSTITATGAGGVPVFQYAINGGSFQSSNVFTSIAAGSYTITIKDANNCTATSSINITQPPVLTLSVTTSSIACNLGTSTITATSSGGSPSYQYKLNNGSYQASGAFANNISGTYTITVKDANNCTLSTTITITQPTPLTLAVTANPILCNANTTAINATGNGGTPGYQYSLNGGALQSSGNYSNVVSGSYTVVVQDANGCTKSTVLAISQPPLLTVSLSSTAIACNGNFSTITATGAGGVPVFQYAINGGSYQSSNVFASIAAGSYTITIKDANNCTATSSINITQPPVLSLSVTTSSIACNLGTSTITATSSGGTPSYQYKLNNGSYQASGVFASNTSGTYTIMVKDANNCTLSTTITITQPTPLTLAVTANPILCNANTTTINATGNGGTPGYQYSLNGGVLQSSGNYSNVVSGSYTVVVQDANGCTKSTVLNITQPSVLSLSATATSILCFGGNSTITATATGGTIPYEFNLNGGVYQTSSVFTNQLAGTYTLMVKDANNCTSSTVVNITQPAVLSATITTSTILCFGGNATLTVTGIGGSPAYQYKLNNGSYQSSGLFTSLTTGTYTLTVKDANNCTTSAVQTLTQPSALTLSISSTPIACNGNTATLVGVASGGTPTYQYSLNGGAYQSGATFSNLNAGSYTLVVKDANNCSATNTVVFSQPTLLQITGVTSTIPTCLPGNDASVSVTATGGTPLLQYKINNGSFQSTSTFNNLGAAIYTITVQDANGCSVTAVQAIVNPNSPNITNTTLQPVTCFGLSNGSISVSVTTTANPLSYTLLPLGLTNATGSFTNLSAGNYTVQATDANNCSISTAVVVQQPALLAASVAATPILCFGDYSTITVNVTGGTPAFQYRINSGLYQSSNNFPGVVAGTYTLGVKDANNCTTTAVITLNQPTLLTVGASSLPILCHGTLTSIQATGNGGTLPYQYQMNGGSFQSASLFSNIGPGTYTVLVKDANNCTSSTNITITQPNLLTLALSSTPILCFGGSSVLSATGTGGVLPYQYNVNGGAYQSGSSFSNLLAGVYTVGIKDANNCTVTATLTLSQPSVLTSVASATSIACFNGTSTIAVTATGGVPGYQYQLNAGAFQSSNIFNPVTAGTYTLTVKDANNCTATTNLTLVAPTAMNLGVVSTPILCANSTATLTATATGGTPNYQFNINGGAWQSSGVFNNIIAGSYTVIAQDANACSVSSIINITQPSGLTLATSSPSILCYNGTVSLTATVTGGVPAYQYSLNGGSNQSANLFANIGAGTYTVQVIDANNCTMSTTLTLTQPTPLTVSGSYLPIACANGTTTISVVANGGTLPSYQYSLNGGGFQTLNQFFNLVAGVYTVTVYDGNNCSATTTIPVIQPPVLTLSLGASAILCNGGVSSITASASGGTLPLSYQLNTAAYQPGNVYYGLTPGTYTITVRDANNCTKSSTILITQPPVLVVTNVTSTQPTCIPGNDANITLAASGGVQPYQYSLNGGAYQTSNQFNSLGASVYTLTIQDANNCTVSTVVNISNPNSPSWNNVIVTPVTCFQLSNGSVVANAQGGTNPIVYTLLPGSISSTTGSYSNLSAGAYTVIATDANNCSVSTLVSVNQPPALTTTITSTPVFCFGDYATITVNANGGTPNYQYQINGGIAQSSSSFPGVIAGTYTLTVTDANNCTLTSSYTIIQPPLLNLSLQSDTIYCFGSTANLVALATGGTPAFEYSLNGGSFQSNATFSALAAGSYTVVVRDGNNCTKSSAVVIQQPPVLSITASAGAILCYGQTTTIAATAGGGVPGYQYSVNGGTFQTANSFSGIVAGNYTLTVKDANNCTASTQIVITEPTPLNLTATNSAIPCAGGTSTIQVTITGGTTGYQYNLNGGAYQSSSIFNTQPAGNYTLTVQDANNCTASTTIVVTEPANLTATVSASIIACANGVSNLTVSAVGGTPNYQYQLNGGAWQSSNAFNGLTAGSYTVQIQDANACATITTITINQPTVLQITSIQTTTPTCVPGNDGTLTVLASGGTLGYQYSVGGAYQSSNILTGLSAAIYTIQVQDANGCTSTSSVAVVSPNAPNLNTVQVTPVSCNGLLNGAITALASGGFGTLQYQLQPGAFNNTTGVFTSLAAGTYTLVVSDANNCTVSSTVAINQPSPLTVSLSSTSILCFGGNAVITATGLGGTPNYQYSINNGPYQSAAVFAAQPAGNYTVTILDANNCTATTSLLITEPPLLTITLAAPSIACYGGNTTLTATLIGGTPGYQFSLNGGGLTSSNIFSNLTQGTYTVLAVDANGCSTVTTILLSEPPLLSITSVAATSPTCIPGNDGTLTVTASGGTLGYQYSVGGAYQSSNILTGLSAAIYTVQVQDANGCTSTSSVAVISPNAPNLNAVQVTPVSCNGLLNGAITALASGGFGTLQYQLQPGAINNTTGVFTSLAAGTYTLVVSDANNCTVSSTVAINQPSPLTVSLSSTSILCFGGNAVITATGLGGTPNYQYSINNGPYQSAAVFAAQPAGNYTVTILDANNCTATTSLLITEPPLLAITLAAPPIACYGGNTTLTATLIGGTPGYQFSLNGGGLTSSNIFSNLTQGTYTVLAVDANGCSTVTTIQLLEPPLLFITGIVTTSPTCIPGNDGTLTVTATGGSPFYQYQASGPIQSSNVLTGLAPSIYTVTVTDVNGCTATSVVNLVAPNSPSISSVTTTDVSCFGGSNGSLSVTGTGGSGALVYTLQPGGATNASGLFSNLLSGTYAVLVTDANNCTGTSVVSLTQPTVLSASATPGVILCFGGSSSLTLSGSGGTPNYTYNVNGGSYQTNPIFNNLTAGVYTISVLDANNCLATDTITLQEPSLLSVTAAATPIACFGGNTTVNAIGSGGTTVYQYRINGSALQSLPTFTGIVAGTYTIEVVDANNCTASTTLLITEPTALQIDSLVATTPTCIPGNDGTLTAFASGGSPAYSYTIGGPTQVSNIINGLSPNTYTVTVIDANGCTITGIQNVVAPTSPIFTGSTFTPVSCFGGTNGSLTTLATGGSGVLTYVLQPGGSSNTTGGYGGLQAGIYTVIVSDSKNCTATTTITITEPTQVQFTNVAIVNTSCAGGSNGEITVAASGGTGNLTYILQPGSVTNTTGVFTTLSLGSYTVVATDANGCSTNTVAVVTSPPPITLSTLLLTNETCNNTQDATITITCSGGTGTLNYTLQPLGITNTTGSFSNLSGGSYTVLVVDANGCSYSTTMNLLNPPPMAFATVNHTDVLCFGQSDGTISASATGGNVGGYTYTLLPPNSTNSTGLFVGFSAGTYTVQASDINACTVTTVVVIVEPAPTVLVIDSSLNATCYGVANGAIYTSISGGVGPFTYTLMPSSQTNNTGDFLAVLAGTYTVQVTDANGCSTTAGPVALTQPPAITFTLLASQGVTCYGGNDGNFTIAVNGGTGALQLSLLPNVGSFTPPGTFTNLSANNYIVTATDANGCTNTTVVVINQNPQIVFDSIQLYSPTCYGDADGVIHAFASGGVGALTYQLNGGLATSSGYYLNLIAGNYLIAVTDALGCVVDSAVLLTQPDPLDFLSVDIKQAECEDNKNGKIIVQAMGGNGDYTYILRPFIRINKFGIFSDLEAGIYTITIKDYKGCEKDTVVQVMPPGVLMQLDIVKNDLGCFGYGTEGWARVDVTNGTPPFTYTWSSVPPQNTQTATGLFFGYYFVDVIDARGCEAKDTVYINPGTCCEEVFIPNAFTPNNDGMNDVFKVTTSAGIELINFAVYDRWGNKVWRTHDFRRHWDGKVNGQVADGNTFFYIFHYKCLTDGQTYMRKGDVMVMH